MKGILTTLFLISCLHWASCSHESNASIEELYRYDAPKGTLFIIGGGNRPDSMIERIITETGIRDSGYAITLTMSGFNPDTSGYYGKRPFRDNGVSNIRSYDFERIDTFTASASDSLQNASLIYITGGSQSRFMEAVNNNPGIAEAIETAYINGAMISGTSAGAAIMSNIMITGDQKNYPDYTPTFYDLEWDNMITSEGLGLIQDVIIDQHFVKRARNNRLLTAVMEYPDHTGIGIDESTAILVKNKTAEVVGESQVLVYKNKSGTAATYKGKLGAENLRLDVYLPGQIFEL